MNIEDFLTALGFETTDNEVFTKVYTNVNYSISIFTNEERIAYRTDRNTTNNRINDGQIQLGDHTTSNIRTPENLVVLECVDRLLTKGYYPNDIHLEKKYPTGRNYSGGKSDICIYHKDEDRALFLLECAQWGNEFKKKKSQTESNGGQIFAYLSNDHSYQFIGLYSSRYNEHKREFEYDNLIIHIKDRDDDLQKSATQIESENLKLYRDAKNKSDYFNVWKESFNKYFHLNGIFDNDSIAYHPTLQALKKKNLKILDDSKGLFNLFAEILRHNNISDYGNAFNRFLSLVLCKIVDEDKSDEEILDFQVKESESYEVIIDRLQKLYQQGMRWLNEEIIYHSEDELNTIISLYPNQTPLNDIKKIFRELKYYTSNEFAFKEVHNEKLFDNNGRVLSEVIKLLQNYKFQLSTEKQILGDFFERMLNHGVKQSEGQFFTSIPIVRFILFSIGIEKLVNQKISDNEHNILPKILDYACGAGHFLTESVNRLNQIVSTNECSEYLKQKNININIGEYIYGIEKDYRLARTTQIACYINGTRDAKIIFGDGLEEHLKLELYNEKFDVVVANPPYSVDSFKNYLNIKSSDYTLYGRLTEKSKEIETLFIERTKYVLKDGGIAGIVLPTSVLENQGIYDYAREILIENFEIKAIVMLGNKTFIATNINTCIVFLKKRSDTFAEDRKSFIDDLFSINTSEIDERYFDKKCPEGKGLVEKYTSFRNFTLEDYQEFLGGSINNRLSQTSCFIDYDISFQESKELQEYKKSLSYKTLTDEEKNEHLNSIFIKYCKEIEKVKMYYYFLTLSDAKRNPSDISKYCENQKTIIIKVDNNVSVQKEFLGYSFTDRKGQEGIRINNEGGKMYDLNNLENEKKANIYIKKNMWDELIPNINQDISKYLNEYELSDLFDFEDSIFINKLSTESKTNWEEFWGIVDLKPLSNVAIIRRGSTITQATTTNGDVPVVAGGKEAAYTHSSSNRDKNIITISSSGANAGYVNYWDVPIWASDCITINSKDGNQVNTKYLYELLKYSQEEISKLKRGTAQPHVYAKDLSKIKIPIIDFNSQNQLLTDLDIIQNKKRTNSKDLDSLIQIEKKEKIKEALQKYFSIPPSI